jgi:predicted DCC family thiol-disulfide oxidoreductase YuxK
VTPKVMTPHPIVLFDGQCGLCTRSVRFIAARDRAGTFRFAPLQGATAARECARLDITGLTVPDGDPGTMILIDGNRALTRSDAALAIASRLTLPWRLLAIMRIIPRPLRDAAYRWIARNRHRWFRGADSCLLPDAGLRERMID